MSSNRYREPFQFQPLWQQLVIVLVFNSLVALLIHSISANNYFYQQFFLSQSIGLSIFASFIFLAGFIRLRGWKMIIPIVVGSLVGICIVLVTKVIVYETSIEILLKEININGITSTFFIAIFFGSIIVLFFVYREAIFKTKVRLQEQQVHDLQNQKKLTEANLRFLQAQIEPHFLFNTLSNVISLIDADPVKAKILLESFTSFLRATLKNSATKEMCLRDELKLVENYLKIFKLRMGKRLNYFIHCQEGIEDFAFSPLLLQPLVENSIIHGIEPVPEGGDIIIDIRVKSGFIQLQVSDTGNGLHDDFISGLGLSNILERIKSIYGTSATLTIEANQPNGVIATLMVPYENH